MVLEIIFYIISGYVVYQLNKELHRDIFASTKRQWKFINEIDGQEYTIEEM